MSQGTYENKTNAIVKPPAAPDSRVKSILDQAGLKYKIDPLTNNFQLVIPLKEGRSQVVIINSQTSLVGAVEIRRVWSPAFVSTGPLTAELANNLLSDNFV